MFFLITPSPKFKLLCELNAQIRVDFLFCFVLDQPFLLKDPVKKWDLSNVIRNGRSLPNPPLFDEPKIITKLNIPFDQATGSFTVGSHYSVGPEPPRKSRHLKKTQQTLQNNRWVVLFFCSQEGACEIPVPKCSDQGDALDFHSWKNR